MRYTYYPIDYDKEVLRKREPFDINDKIVWYRKTGFFLKSFRDIMQCPRVSYVFLAAWRRKVKLAYVFLARTSESNGGPACTTYIVCGTRICTSSTARHYFTISFYCINHCFTRSYLRFRDSFFCATLARVEANVNLGSLVWRCGPASRKRISLNDNYLKFQHSLAV